MQQLAETKLVDHEFNCYALPFEYKIFNIKPRGATLVNSLVIVEPSLSVQLQLFVLNRKVRSWQSNRQSLIRNSNW